MFPLSLQYLLNFNTYIYQAIQKSSRPDDNPEHYILVEDTTRWLRDASGERTPATQLAPRALESSERICQRSTQAKFFLCRKSEVRIIYTLAKILRASKFLKQALILFYSFSLNFWRTSFLFVGPLISLLWTSGDICPGSHSQDGSPCLHRSSPVCNGVPLIHL